MRIMKTPTFLDEEEIYLFPIKEFVSSNGPQYISLQKSTNQLFVASLIPKSSVSQQFSGKQAMQIIPRYYWQYAVPVGSVAYNYDKSFEEVKKCWTTHTT